MNNLLSEQIKKHHMTQLAAYRRKLWKEPKLKFLFIEMTDRCNLHCRHCGSSCTSSENSKMLSYGEICDFLKKTSEQFNTREMQLCITGGEPLLRKDFFEIMNYACKLGYNWGMTSNATLIDDNCARLLHESGMKTISVSIDGLRETHDWFRQKQGSYDMAMNGLRALLRADCFHHVQVTTVVHKKNIEELEEMYKILSDEKIHSWRVINIEPIGRAKQQPELLLDDDDYRKMFSFIERKRKSDGMTVGYSCSHFLGYELEREIRKWYFLCNAGIYTASIMCNGDIGACLDIERRPELIQGNIRTDDFHDVWLNRFKEFRSEYRKCDECSKCRYEKFCGEDSFHTWNFDENKPNLCFKGILFD